MNKNKKKLLLILFNIKLIILVEVFLVFFQSFAVTLAVTLQKWGESHNPKLLWYLSESLGPEPRLLTFTAIVVFARDGLEAIRLFTLRFLAHYLRWLLGIFLQEPRPSWISDNVQMLHCPTSFGLPSGHALLIIAVFVPIVFGKGRGALPKVLFFVWFTAMVVGRIYLGTHSPHDLMLASSLGLCLIYVFDEASIETLITFLQSGGSPKSFILSFVILGIGLSEILSFAATSWANGAAISHYQARAATNHCSQLILFSAREGLSALATFTGILLAIVRNCISLASLKLRVLSFAVVLLTKLYIDLPWVPESLFLSSVLFGLASYMLFEPSPEEIETTIKEAVREEREYGTLA